MYLGIDVGQAGALVLLNDSSEIMEAHTMPKDPRDRVKLMELLTIGKPHVILERAQAMPKQGITGMFTYGEGYGLLQGAIMTLGLKLTILRPKEWQKLVIEPNKKLKPKDLARQTAMNLWPDQCWLATQRCSVQHEGLIDAALIAEAGRRLLR